MKIRQESVKTVAAVFHLVAMMLVWPSELAANILTNGAAPLPHIVQNDIAIESKSPDAGVMHPANVALLLPLRSPMLAEAAAAVRDGFLAAWQSRARPGVATSVEIIETTDSVADHLAQYGRVQLNNQLIIGPLTRAAVAASLPVVTQTMIALAPAGQEYDGFASALKNAPQAPVIMAGLSIEDEARQLADWAVRHEQSGVAWIVSTEVPWRLREALGAALPAYGTSQLNPFNAAQRQQARPVPQLEGVRALGHDAFLVMEQLLKDRTHFSLDGQTGSLSVHLDHGSMPRFTRRLTSAIYEEGRVTIWWEDL